MTTRQQPPQPLHNNPADPIWPLDRFLTTALGNTEYRYGRLNFPQPIEKDELDELIDLRGPHCGGWMTQHQIEMVLHPQLGAILLRDCTAHPQDSGRLLRDRIEDAHRQLVDLQRQLRRRLDEKYFWRGRPIVLGIGIVVRQPFSDDDLPHCVPRALVIDTCQNEDFKPRLEQLFDFYATPATKPVNEYGPQLVEDLTNSPDWIGNFIDETTLETMYDTANEDPDRAA